MTLTREGTNDPNEESPIPEIPVRIVLTNEFAGYVLRELEVRGGYVLSMDTNGKDVLIRARLRSTEFENLRNAILDTTSGRGRLEHDPGA